MTTFWLPSIGGAFWFENGIKDFAGGTRCKESRHPHRAGRIGPRREMHLYNFFAEVSFRPSLSN
jgi:hypothetical protein